LEAQLVTDQDYKELKKRVNFLYKYPGLTYVPEPMPADDPRIAEASRKGNGTEAMRLHRQTLDSSLEEAATAVDEAMKKIRP